MFEETLGHITHARNLEQSIVCDPDIMASIRRVVPQSGGTWRDRLPLIASWSFQASWAARHAVRQELRRGPVDALYVHTQVAALLLDNVMASIPTVISLDATPANFDAVGAGYKHHRGLEPIEAVKRAVNRRAFAAAAGLVAFSRWAADSLVRDYAVPPERIRVIRPGVDLGLFRPADDHPDGRRVRILFVGGDFSRKGGHELLAAMSLLGDNAELDIVTGSSVTPPPGVRCRVHTGLSSNSPELVSLYRAADVFALPTRSDVNSFAIVEAMACGLPVVASSVGGIPDLIHDGINGMLVPARAPEQLASVLQRLIDQPGLRRTLGRAGLAVARRHHDAVRNGQAILGLMKRVSAQG